MVFRLLTIPLSKENYSREECKIKEIAKTNGYFPEFVDNIIKKYKQKMRISNCTKLSPINDKQKPKRAKISLHPPLSNKIKHILSKQNIQLTEVTHTKLGMLLGKTINKLEPEKKSGVYKLKCGNCEKVYIGQSKRAISERYKEHIRDTNKGETEKSSVAQHMIAENHTIARANFELIREVRGRTNLDIWESIHIHINQKHIMNNEPGKIRSPLFTKFISTIQ